MPPAPRRSRRCVRFESDEDSVSEDGNTQEPLSREEQAKRAQMALTMADLGPDRHHQMTQDAGPRAKYVNVMALKRGRECNQEGSKANELAMENKQALNNWSNYGQTADAKAAGAEVKEDIAAGNSHRERVKREMQEQGVTKLEDTYDEHRPRGFKNHPGATSAMANDRGRYGTARGGGNAGRGIGRGASMAARTGRPLDPAVDPDRPYALKSKGPKKKPGIRGEMVQGTVVVKATDKQQGSKKKPGQYSSPRLDRGPLPDHVRQTASPKLVDAATFMQATLNMFKKQAESGKQITADKGYKAVSAAQTTVQSVASTEPAPVRSKLLSQATPDLAKKSPKVQHVERKELGVMEKSPDAFTDGNATTATLSGFTPSIASQDGALGAANSLAGLGIQGAMIQDMDKSNLMSAIDLMDVDVPGANNSSLKSPLQASPRDSHFGTTEYEEYKLLKEFKAYMDSKNSQDFTQWLNKQKSGSSTVQDTSQETGKQRNASPVDISGGYTMGGSSLERILDDDKNIVARTKAAKTKTTQTTPGLAQSKWASPEVRVLSTFKESSAGQAQKRKLDTVEEVAAPVESTQPIFSQATVVNNTVSQGTSAIVVQAKRTNPFTRREDSDSPAAQPIPIQTPAVAAESTASSMETVRYHGVRIDQRSLGQSQPAKSAGTKKGLSSSMWATDGFSASSVSPGNTSRQMADSTESMNKASSIFGDSQNVQKSSGALAPIQVNTVRNGKSLGDSKFASHQHPSVPSKMSLPRPFAGVTTQTTLQDGYRFTPGTPIVGSRLPSEPGSLIGDAKNIQKSPSKWGRDPASRFAQAKERKSTGIKRTHAGPGYDRIMREQKAEKEKLEAEKAASGAKSVDEMVSEANQYKNQYVGADDFDSDEEL